MPISRSFAIVTIFAVTQLAAAAETDHGLDLAAMDKSVPPGNDFNAYSSGGWEKTAVIPADRGSWGVFAELRESADKRTRGIIEDAAKANAPAGSNVRKVGDYYASFMDEAAIETKGLTPLASELAAIAAVNDAKSLAHAFGKSLRNDVDPLNNTNFHTDHLFGLWVAPGFGDAQHYAPYLLEGGIGMPDREYYLATTPRMTELREKYRAHVAAVLKLAGIADADALAPKIVALETRIAKAHLSREENEDVLKANNPWTRDDFVKKAPGLDWLTFFSAANLDAAKTFIVWQPGTFTAMAKIVAETPIDQWKAFLAFHLVDEASNQLPKRFADEDFAFYGQALSGTPKQLERWKRAVAGTNHALGDAVGELYAKRYFPPAAKAAARAMVDNIVTAFAHRIDRLDWMSPATKTQAKAKVASLYVGIGYPDKWRDYSKLEIVRGDALGNWQRARRFEYERVLAKLGQSVDRTEWSMTPQTVNAVNLPLQNALNFPAAILEPPFFDAKADAALNYGGMGSVIGHEISHSFDDQGAQFDATGRLANWWTKDDLAHFKAAAAKLVAQYNAYKAFPDLSVNGQVTLSENIADVAGLSAAFDGWRASLGKKKAPSAQGFSGEQRFFLSFAQTRRSVSREASLRRQVLTDGHAPGKFRAQTVRNLDGWYDAFAVKPGQTLYLAPADRVRVW